MEKHLSSLAKQIHQVNRDNGFYDHNPTEREFLESVCNNMHDEVSELHEAWRNGKLNDPCDKSEKMATLGLDILTCGEEELADIAIRVFDAMEHLGYDADRIIAAKNAYNATRGHKHGGKLS